MRIAEHAALLKIESGIGHVNPVLTWDDHHLVLIDAGFPGQTEAIVQAIAAEGFFAEALTDIMLTHQDMDHIGCVLDLREYAPAVRLWAHEEEAPYLDGRKTPVKLAAMLAQYETLPDDRKAWCDRMKEGYANRRLTPIKEVTDGEVLPFCGGIEVIHTPGHTPGHMVLLLRESGIMVCGDALNIQDGQPVGPNPVHTYDMSQGMQSFEKIIARAPRGVAAYHGGYIDMQ